jgi:hypothetical protein
MAIAIGAQPADIRLADGLTAIVKGRLDELVYRAIAVLKSCEQVCMERSPA